jgi:hypothetical protein
MWINVDQDEALVIAGRMAETHPDLAERIHAGLADLTNADAEALRLQAEGQYATDDCEIDDGATVSRGDLGAFVMAWVYVSFEDAGLHAEEDEDEE